MSRTVSTGDDWRSWDAWSKARLRWRLQARPEQLTPESDWNIWLFLAGRGTGKTRSGAEDMSDFARRNDDARLALVGATFTDCRDTMVEGESGLLSVLPPSALRGGDRESAWNRSMGELYFANGAQAKCFSSEKPNRLRGPQHHRAWGDEPAAWGDAHLGDVVDTTFNNLMLGLRLGEHPQLVITGTPKRVKLVRQLLKRPGLHLSRGSTYDNLDNLAPTFKDEILSQYEGTRLGRQELLGELLEDVEGALWTYANLDEHRCVETPELVRVVVAIDPAVTSTEDSDETGIIVAGLGTDGHGYVLADRSCVETPDGWARRSVAALEEFEGDRIVAEVNNGGDLVEHTIRTVSRAAPYKALHASRGKRTRAEPVAALYEQGRVHHVGALTELEDQMTEWTPESGTSPDRLDALVWALTDLMIDGARRGGVLVA